MDRPDEKQPATSTTPETSVPAPSSVVTAAQAAASVRNERLNPNATAERSVPLNSLRGEIRVWTRDLLIAIGLALVIIVFLYQPVKVEGTSMAPLLSERPTASPLRKVLRGQQAADAILAIGPEGGWTDAEFAAAQRSGFLEASLGRRILRTETAVVTALASLNFALGDE